MSDNDFVYQAVARAKQVAAKLAASGDGQLQNNNGSSSDSYSGVSIGMKRPASDSIGGVVEKKSIFNDKLSAAAEAAARINEKLGASSGNNPLSNQTITVYHTIPDKFVGLVIGKKGEQIIQLQQDACCKVQISQDGGQPERDMTMVGTPSQIERAKQMINEIIERAGGTVSGGSGSVHSIDVMIPGQKAGLIIGKNGETIKQLQDATGAKMVLIQDSNAPSQNDKPLRITGDQQAVEKAKDMVIHLLATKDGKGGFPKMQLPQPPENADLCVYSVPTEKAGLVIGKGGETIREICTRSGAFVEISKQQPVDPASKLFNVRGQRHEIEGALRYMSERAGIPVGAPHSYFPGGQESAAYGAGQQWAGYASGQTAAGQQGQPTAAMPPPTINPQTGQPDYSAAWAEYYRRQGMHEYADMILRQAAQQGSVATPQLTAQPAYSATSTQQPAYHVTPTPQLTAQPAYPAAPTEQQPDPQSGYDYSGQWEQWHQWQQSTATPTPVTPQPWMGQQGPQTGVTAPQAIQPSQSQHAAWSNASNYQSR